MSRVWKIFNISCMAAAVTMVATQSHMIADGREIGKGMTHPEQPTNIATKSASGLEFEDVQVGKGPVPPNGSHVTVHYTGWLLDGTKFDSSVDRGQPFDFVLGAGQVIKGWDEGVASMHVGGKRRLRIPPQLAYGAKGFPPVIPPNSTLVFDVELLKFE